MYVRVFPDCIPVTCLDVSLGCINIAFLDVAT